MSQETGIHRLTLHNWVKKHGRWQNVSEPEPPKLRFCPHLGSALDRSIVYGYPHPANVCHAQAGHRVRLGPFKMGRTSCAQVSVDHQTVVCLRAEAWPSCERKPAQEAPIPSPSAPLPSQEPSD